MLTLEDFKNSIEKYFTVNGKYPTTVRISKSLKCDPEFKKYCCKKEIKINYV